MSRDENDPVGSVGEEAAKLLKALQGWATETDGDGDSSGTAASAAASTWQKVNEHVATGGQDCRYCPLCQAISVVRETSPEVRHHLATAATSLLQAVEGVLATQAPRPGGRPTESPVEKIDLGDDHEPWEDE